MLRARAVLKEAEEVVDRWTAGGFFGDADGSKNHGKTMGKWWFNGMLYMYIHIINRFHVPSMFNILLIGTRTPKTFCSIQRPC